MWSHSLGCAAQAKACGYRHGGAKIIRAQVAPEDADLLLKYTEITNQKGVGLSLASDSSYWTMA